MTFAANFSTPFFTGTRHPGNVVPGRYDVALGGRPYQIDTLRADTWRHSTVPLLRRQADGSDEPSEASLNPEDLWRRSMSSWHGGAGQLYADGPTAREPHRFATSKGVNPWDERKLTLLKDTYLAIAPVSVNPVVAQGWLYAANSSAMVRFNGSINEQITGEPVATPYAQATDGSYVWVAYGSSGIYRTDVSTTAISSYVTGTATGLAFASGRLLAWHEGTLWNVTGAGALGDASNPQLMSRANWTIVGCSEGQGFIYTAARSDDKSLIYKTTITADGTALGAPSVAATLPDGEVVYAIYGYLGFQFIGTSRGVRFATADSGGNLVLGATIETPNPVEAFEGQGRFVWFGWTNFDSESSGLGRVDPTTLNGTSPAYASDLMAPVQGAVKAITTWNDRRIFWVEGEDYWSEHATRLVPSGTVTSGYTTYGLVDHKVVKRVDVVLSADGGGSVMAELASDGTFTTLGTVTPGGEGVLPAKRARARHFQVRLTLNRDAVNTVGPTVEWVTLRAYPALGTTEIITVPLLLFDQQASNRAQVFELAQSPAQELANLRGLRDQAQIVSYQEGIAHYQVLVVGVDWAPERRGRAPGVWNGTALVTLKTFGGLVE